MSTKNSGAMLLHIYRKRGKKHIIKSNTVVDTDSQRSILSSIFVLTNVTRNADHVSVYGMETRNITCHGGRLLRTTKAECRKLLGMFYKL